jgi:Zn-dependent peptidase ImmA (M78 family)
MSIVLQKKANSFRDRNGLTSNEAIRLKSLLIKLNIITLFRPLSATFSGMSLKVNNTINFILVNSKHSLGRQHFTIAHELYHLFIQENFYPHQCYTGTFNKKNREEYNADCFASYFLMPESGILELIPDNELSSKTISLQTILKLEQYFSVSRASILVRLKMLKLLSTTQYDMLKNYKVIQTARQYGYDTSLYLEGNHNQIIGDYGEKARRLFDNEIISEGHYMELMQQIGIDITVTENDEEN